MTNENKLEIKVNGNYKNIDLRDMDDQEAIIVEKKFDTVSRDQKPSKFKEGEFYTMVRGAGVYNGEEVGFFINGQTDGDGNFVDADAVADLYDATGGQGTKVKVTCTKTMGKDKNGKDKVFRSYVFAKIE